MILAEAHHWCWFTAFITTGIVSFAIFVVNVAAKTYYGRR